MNIGTQKMKQVIVFMLLEVPNVKVLATGTGTVIPNR